MVVRVRCCVAMVLGLAAAFGLAAGCTLNPWTEDPSQEQRAATQAAGTPAQTPDTPVVPVASPAAPGLALNPTEGPSPGIPPGSDPGADPNTDAADGGVALDVSDAGGQNEARVGIADAGAEAAGVSDTE